jgi:hypothetical protein
MTPTPDYLRSEIDDLAKELDDLLGPFAPEFEYWRDRVNQVIKDVVGAKDVLAIRFSGLQWTSSASPVQRRIASTGGFMFSSTAIGNAVAFTRAQQEARELLKMLKWKLGREYQVAGSSGTVLLDATSIEPDLWDYVVGLVEIEQWEMVPRQAAVFIEDKLREWTKPPESQSRSSTEVFKFAVSETKFALGHNSSEQQGWQQLFAGFAMAIRNDAGHKLGDRAEAKRHAIAVLGTASLLLGEIRHRYGDPPQLLDDH